MSDAIAIIPARYASTRLPGKPLADIHGKPMIVHVMDAVAAVIDTYVATDDARIAAVVQAAGGKVIMTDEQCANGTERVKEALLNSGQQPDIVLNIQGDEPMVNKQDIQTLLQLMQRPDVQIGTLVTPSKPADHQSTNNCFVERLPDGLAIGFSREAACCSSQAWRHVGMYGFKGGILDELIALPPTAGEKSQRLEQLRWHESGYAIHTAEVAQAGLGVDSPEDLERVRQLMA